MKHTPEPWMYDEELASIRCIENHCLSCNIAMPVNRRDGIRIVACVNACAGIADPADLRKQRDELLAALRRIADSDLNAKDVIGCYDPNKAEELQEIARAAIANAEPKE